MVADGLGRMSGVLNGGVGRTEFSDVTYVTPCGGSGLASRPSFRMLGALVGIASWHLCLLHLDICEMDAVVQNPLRA